MKYFEYRKSRGSEDIPQILSSDEVGEELIDEESQVIKKPVTLVKKRTAKVGDDEMNIDEIRELMLLLDNSSIAELELQNESFKLILRKANIGKEGATASISVGAADRSATVSEVPEAASEKIVEVLAPMVGTFYAAPSPDSAPYVKVGDNIRPGQVLCIVEAMKLMNEIKSESSGTIVDILIKNAEVVEYGQVIFLIEED